MSILVSPLIRENHMEKKMENEMDTRVIWGIIRFIVYRDL